MVFYINDSGARVPLRQNWSSKFRRLVKNRLPFSAFVFGLAASNSAQAKTDIFDTELFGAVVVGILSDGSLRVRLVDNSIFILLPGTFSVEEDKVYVQSQIAEAIESFTLDRATADSNSIEDLPVFTNASQAEVQEGQSFVINVDANISGVSSGLTYSIVEGEIAEKLDIDPGTGIITLKPGEILTTDEISQILVVRATNQDGDFAEQEITVTTAPPATGSGTLGPLAVVGGSAGALLVGGLIAEYSEEKEEGSNTAPSFSTATANATIMENTTVITDYQASAGNGAVYSIISIDDRTGLGFTKDDFAISGSGNLAYTGSMSMDREAMSTGQVILNIQAQLNNKTAIQSVTLEIEDVDEFNIAFTSSAPSVAYSIDENAVGNISGYVAAADDQDATDSVRYEITNVAYKSASGSTGLSLTDFSVDASGVLSVVTNNGLNFETLDDNLLITITATSTDGSQDTQQVEIEVVNKNDAPTFSPDAVNVLVDENQATNLYHVVAFDEDNISTVIDTLTYQITDGNSAGIFQINSSTGHLSFVDSTNEANDGVYQLTISATDNNSTMDPVGNLFDQLTLNVTVNEIA